jgi:transcriptional regulator with XRE-family HTH domain
MSAPADIVSGITAAEMIREARRRHGVTQRSLALRAGTSQAAISRMESGTEIPTLERLERVLLVLGERLVLDTAPLDPEIDPGLLRAARAMTPEQRLAEAASWNRFAGDVERAGRRARERG